jgi:hypothetical protein
MSELRFFTDEHVHKAVVEELRKRGVDVVRVEDMGWKGEDDLPLLEYAAAEGRSIVTGDDDFLAHHTRWQDEGQSHCGIFYILPRVRQRGKAAIGIIVNELWFYCEAVQEGAATTEQDIYNQVIYIGGR